MVGWAEGCSLTSSFFGGWNFSEHGRLTVPPQLLLLTPPTLVARRHNPAVKPFYEKLVAKGKPKKSALIACERKLLMICYGVVKSGKPFEVTT